MSSETSQVIRTKVESGKFGYHLDANLGTWKLNLYHYLDKLLQNIEPNMKDRKALILGDNGFNMKSYWMKSLTHYSMNQPDRPKIDYEELELIGDRVMALNFTDYIMAKMEHLDKGAMSHLKNYYMSDRFQPKLTRKINLDSLIRIKPPKEGIVILDNGILTDLIEALFGALYKAAPNRAMGIEYTYRFMQYLFNDITIDLRLAGSPNKTLLIELFKTMGYEYNKKDKEANVSSFVLDVEPLEHNFKRMFIKLNKNMVAELNVKIQIEGIGQLPGRDTGYILAEVKSRSYHTGEAELYKKALENLRKIGYTKSFVDRQAGWQEITAIDNSIGIKAIQKSISAGWEYIRFREPDKGAKSDISAKVVVSMALNGIKIENPGTSEEKVIREIITPFITENCDRSDHTAYNECVNDIKLQLLKYYVNHPNGAGAGANVAPKQIKIKDIVGTEVVPFKSSDVKEPSGDKRAASPDKNLLKLRPREKSPVKSAKSPTRVKEKSPKHKSPQKDSSPISSSSSVVEKFMPYDNCTIDIYKQFLSPKEQTELIEDIKNNIDFTYMYSFFRITKKSKLQYGWIIENNWEYVFDKTNLLPLKPQNWINSLTVIKNKLESIYNIQLNAVLISKFTDKDSTLSWQSNNDKWLSSDPDDEYLIPSLFLGQGRTMSIKRMQDNDKKKPVEQLLSGGNLVVMQYDFREICEYAIIDSPNKGKSSDISYMLTFFNIKQNPSTIIKLNKPRKIPSELIKEYETKLKEPSRRRK